MKNAINLRSVVAVWAVAFSVGMCSPAGGAVSLLGVQYQEDDLSIYTEYACFWKDSNYPTSCGVPLPGANLHVFIKNDGASAVGMDDVVLAGYSLSYALREVDNNGHIANSIWYRWDNPPADLLAAGEPAWYKMDPKSIPAGGVGQIIVRLRRLPTASTIAVDVDTSANVLNTIIAVDPNVPQLANISFSADLTKAYLYWRRTGGAAPATVKMDGTDVTSITTTVGDVGADFAMSVVSLPAPISEMSYHVFQGVYSDSSTATGGIRAWVNPFTYSSWAAFPTSDTAMAQAWMNTCQDRGINTLEMNSASDALMSYFGTSAGKAYADSRNYGFIKDDNSWGTWSNNPRMWFIDDEPDIEEANMLNNFCGTGYKLPCSSNQAGTMGMHFVERGEELRNIKNRPTTINMDGTWKPYSYFAYGQLSDCLCIDHYFQPKVRHAYTDLPNTLPLYRQAKVVYATALAGARAAEPNPSRQLLYSCQINNDGPRDPWPWAPPECKRVEAYYALAAGAKGLGYWWFKKNPSASNGLGDANLQAQDPALWEEIGLIGAETKLLQPYLVTSHPVELDAVGSTNVWVKALARGTDTFILFVVNDDYWLDEDYHGTPVANASVTLPLPSWMVSSATAFEVGRTGIHSVGTSQSGTDLTLALGTLNVAKIVIVTVDPQLRMTVQQRYDQFVWPGICNFAPAVCHQNTSMPSVVVQPSPQSSSAGGSAAFTIIATGGSQMSYQWQKNSANLTNGGHYSGCTTPFLTVSTIDNSDVANYRCVVTNPYGTATSNQAALTLGTSSGPTITQQPLDQSVNTGATATFTVAATGTAPLSYLWQKDEVNLTNGGHYSGCTTTTLTISLADSGDAASYRCVVTNPYGSATSEPGTLTLLVPGAPTITQHPSNQSVIAGGSTTFTITATGSGTLSYQWQKNQANLTNGGHYSGCTTATLTVSSVSSADVANYRCVVTSPYGSATSNEAALTINSCTAFSLLNGNFDASTSGWSVAANWTSYSSATGVFGKDTTTYRSAPNAQKIEPPSGGAGAYAGIRQTVGASVGDAITFEAYAYQNSTNTYETARLGARFDGSTTPPSSWQSVGTKQVWTRLTVSGKAAVENGVTVFLDVLRGSTGNYWSSFDDVSAYWAYVPPAPAVGNPTSNSLSVDVDPGCNSNNTGAEFAITIGGGAYTLGTHWVQSGGSVGTAAVWQTDTSWGSKTVTGLTTGTAYTFQVKARYSSSYTQETSLGAGAVGTPAGSTLPPTVTQQPSAQNICPGGTATFTVAASGDGTLTYQWQKNGANITNGGHYSGCTTTTLAVSSADGNDVAGYRCVVSNGAGSTNSNAANLTLKAATVITQQPQTQSVTAGATATFTVAAGGEGTLAYQWQKNSANVTNGGHYSGCTTPTLTISSADSSDAANYRCVVTAGCGTATSNQAALTVGATVVPGDFDADGDIDLADFAVLQDCLTGYGVPVTEPACVQADLTSDGFIDHDDVIRFVTCLSGAEIPANPNCVVP